MTGGIPAETVTTVLLLAATSGVATVIGFAIALRVAGRPVAVATGLGFSAGVMLLLPFFELLPEAVRIGGILPALLGGALGAGLLAVIRAGLTRSPLGRGDEAAEAGTRAAYLVAVGLILHDLPEGFAMANAYLAAPTAGIVMAVSIAVHKVPEEFAIALPAAPLPSRRPLYGAALASVLAEPLGAAAGLLLAGSWPSLHPAFLGFAAGAMAFVSVAELLPLAYRIAESRRALAGGILLSAVVYTLLAILIRWVRTPE